MGGEKTEAANPAAIRASVQLSVSGFTPSHLLGERGGERKGSFPCRAGGCRKRGFRLRPASRFPSLDREEGRRGRGENEKTVERERLTYVDGPLSHSAPIFFIGEGEIEEGRPEISRLLEGEKPCSRHSRVRRRCQEGRHAGACIARPASSSISTLATTTSFLSGERSAAPARGAQIFHGRRRAQNLRLTPILSSMVEDREEKKKNGGGGKKRRELTHHPTPHGVSRLFLSTS